MEEIEGEGGRRGAGPVPTSADASALARSGRHGVTGSPWVSRSDQGLPVSSEPLRPRCQEAVWRGLPAGPLLGTSFSRGMSGLCPQILTAT